jgi:hypothetical protein
VSVVSFAKLGRIVTVGAIAAAGMLMVAGAFARAEPSGGEPPKAEPGRSEPARSEPGGSAPGGSQPGGSEQGGSKPGGSEQGGSEQGGSEQGGSEQGYDGGEPARAEGTWIQVNPSTVQAGERVEIKASCAQKIDEAKAVSKAFGEVILVPQYDSLTGQASVAREVREGDYEVKLICAKSGHAETKLRVIGYSRPDHGPHTGGGGLAGGGDGTVALAGGLATIAAGGALAVALRRRRRLV